MFGRARAYKQQGVHGQQGQDIVCFVLINYEQVTQAVRAAAQHGVDLSSYLLKGTQTESWTGTEAKVIQTWSGLASILRNAQPSMPV